MNKKKDNVMKLKILLSLIPIFILFGCIHHKISIQDIERAKTEGLPILINTLFTSYPNSVGGVDVEIRGKNISDKTFKYVYYNVMAYNNVGDIQSSEIGNKIVGRLKDTGPIKPNWLSYGTWGSVWYNNSIRCVELTSIEIIYMDGESVTIEGEKLKKSIVSSLKNSCAYKE